MANDLASGFADPVFAAQSSFRAVMNAMARPGSVHAIACSPQPPAGLCGAAAAVALALFDNDTPVWLDAALRASQPVRQWLAFHAGCPLTEDPARAAFALAGRAGLVPALNGFSPGTPD